LEGGRGIAKAKIHDLRDETAKGGEKCSTETVLWCNVNVVESPANIKFSKDHGGSKAHDQLIDEREQIVIRNSPLIDFSIVHDWTKRSIELLDEEEGGCDGGLSFYYTSQL